MPRDRNVALVATGTGVAPYMSMLRTELECGDSRRFAVLHGARHSWDLGYAAELHTMRRLCPNFTYLPTVSRPDEEGFAVGWRDGSRADPLGGGRARARLVFRTTPEDTHVFLCGNPEIIDDMIALLEREEFRVHEPHTPGQIHFERYW